MESLKGGEIMSRIEEGDEMIPRKERALIVRPGFGTKGEKVSLLANHFGVKVDTFNLRFHQYSVKFEREDGRPIEARGMGRKVMDKIRETYASELDGKSFAYDGESTLFTLGSLRRKVFEFFVVLDSNLSSTRVKRERSSNYEDSSPVPSAKRMRSTATATATATCNVVKVEIRWAGQMSLTSIADACRGRDSNKSKECIMVLDILLRQNAAKKGCLVLHQSFFRDEQINYFKLDRGISACRGFTSSFRITQQGLTLNMDTTTTLVVEPGPVLDYLLSNQAVRDPHHIDWVKAKKVLKNLKIRNLLNNRIHKITGLSENTCKKQMFQLEEGEGTVEISVYDFFTKYKQVNLRHSADFPCVNIGKPRRPLYIPIELCDLIPLQRYINVLSSKLRAALVEKSRAKPYERKQAVERAFKDSNYGADEMLRSCGISIRDQFSGVEGRVLQAPKLIFGNGNNFSPARGRWNLNNKRLVTPERIECWAVIDFSAKCDVNTLINGIVNCGRDKGMYFDRPLEVFVEDRRDMNEPADVRVARMLRIVKKKMQSMDKYPTFLLCILPLRKTCDLYGPWKRECLTVIGVATQCVAPSGRLNDQFFTNLILKINTKLGGLNSKLSVEHLSTIPVVSASPTMIMGMDVSHGHVGCDTPSIAAVVGSRRWPSVSHYRASVRAQERRTEMISDLFNPDPKDPLVDHGIMRELLVEFYRSSNMRKPEQIIIFRDGVSDSQFNQLLNLELEQIMQACSYLDTNWHPKFTVVVAQKRHSTRFFQNKNFDNVVPGTVVDKGVCHPSNHDFYLCAHAGLIGTSRPTHYTVLYDESGFSADQMQELVHVLSYVYQRSSTAVSLVAPIMYAHQAAAQVGQFVKVEEFGDAGGAGSGSTLSSGSGVAVQLPKLKERICNSMFFC